MNYDTIDSIDETEPLIGKGIVLIYLLNKKLDIIKNSDVSKTNMLGEDYLEVFK